MKPSLVRTCAAVLLITSPCHAVDHNGNGMSDVWELLFHGEELFSPADPFLAPTADADGDGWSNLKESIAGTDPFSGTPNQGFLVPHIEVSPYAANVFNLSWPSLVGKEYRLMVSGDLATWTPMGEPIAGFNGPIGIAVSPADEEDNLPSKLFYRVSVSDQATPGGLYTPWDIDVLMDHPRYFSHLSNAGGTTGGAGVDMNSDNTGPTDLLDASRNDNKINWERLPEARYLWIPADLAGEAVDMNDKGKIVFRSLQTIQDFETVPVGRVWDPFETGGGRLKPVYFRPPPFQLRVWKIGNPAPGSSVDSPDETDPIVLEDAPWPPPIGDPHNFASAQVTLQAIADDDSLIAGVGYSFAETLSGNMEGVLRYGGCAMVSAWGPGTASYGGCRLLGQDHGFGDNITSQSGNQAVGFYKDGSGRLRAMVADQESVPYGGRSRLTFKGFAMNDIGLAPELFPGEPDRLQDSPMAMITRGGRVIFTSPVSGGGVKATVTGVGGRHEIPPGVFYEAISDMPDGSDTGVWGLGSAALGFNIWNGSGFTAASSAVGVLQWDKAGTGIGDGAVNSSRHIWRNNRWYTLGQATNLPEATFQGLRPRKITSSGLIWVSNENRTVNGVLIPVTVKDNEFARGVDDESIKALPTSKGYQDKFWITAPCGSYGSGAGIHHNNDSQFLIAPIQKSLVILNGGTTITPSTIVTQDSLPGATVSWHGDGNATIDTFPEFTAANVPANGQPVGVKIMKKRLISVHVYQIANKTPNDVVINTDSSMIPTEIELESYLDELFGWQINAYFDVTMHGGDVPVGWDVNGDHAFNNNTDVNDVSTGDMAEVMRIAPSAGAITIYLIGSRYPLGSDPTRAGFACRTERTCWILAKNVSVFFSNPTPQFQAYSNKESVKETIGHEIGHIFFGFGHPDQSQQPGLAPLMGSDISKRLMVGGYHAVSPLGERLTVKTEWDEYERWWNETFEAPN